MRFLLWFGVGAIAVVVVGALMVLQPDVRQLLRTQAVPTASPAASLVPLAATQSGNWSDPATWGGVVPTAAHAVTIGSGITVTYDMPHNADPTAEAGSLTITNGGALIFSRLVSTRLDLDASLVVRSGGRLDIGTAADPIPATITTHLGFNVPNDRLFSSNDPNDPNFQPGPNPNMPDFHPEDIGLWVIESGSTVTLHGAPKPAVWTKLAADAPVGTMQIVLVDAPGGWRVGDRVLITTSDVDFNENDVRTIVAINGNTITVDQPLTFAHDGKDVIASDGVSTIPVRSEVALLSHNVTVASNLVALGDPNHRAHTVAMMGGRLEAAYTEFRDLGPRAKFGRYPVHFHKAGSTVQGVLVEGISVWNSTPDPGNKWITIHAARGVTVRGSVGFNAQGAGYYLEDANEVGNVLEGNLGVLVYGPEELPNSAVIGAFGYVNESAAVFWLREGNTYRNNVAVGAGPGDAAAYWVTPNTGSTAGFPTTIEGNEAHSSSHGILYSGQNLTSTFTGGLVWRSGVGVYGTDATTGATTRDSTFFGNATYFLNPKPGNLISNKVFPDIPEALAGRWVLLDYYRHLNTPLFTFGPAGQGNQNYYSGDFADFDGDGRMDRSLVSRYGLLRNTGLGIMDPAAGQEGVGQTARPNPTGFMFRDAPDNTEGNIGDDADQWADIDNDGDYDHIGGGNGEAFHIQENRNGQFLMKFKSTTDLSYSALNIVNTDVENDGDVDLVVAYDLGSGTNFDLWINDGSGALTEESVGRGLNLAKKHPSGLASGDVDGDGDFDLIIGSNTDGVLYEAINDGTGRYSLQQIRLAQPLTDPTEFIIGFHQGVNLGDLDGDGDLDLFVGQGELDGGGSHPDVNGAIFINDGAGVFTEESASRFNVGTYSGPRLTGGNAKLLDIDYDGDLDILMFDKRNGAGLGKRFSVFLNSGAGVFTYDVAHSLLFPGHRGEIGAEMDITDVDGDGTYDLWFGLGGEDVRILANKFAAADGLPADIPRNVQLESAGAGGVTISFEHPAFAVNARYYKVYRATQPGLPLAQRQLVKIVGQRHQDEGFAAPVDRTMTTQYLGDPDVVLDGAANKVTVTDRTAQAGTTYYYSVVHVGTENTASRPSAEVASDGPLPSPSPSPSPTPAPAQLLIEQPADGSTLSSGTVDVRYSSAGDQTGVDHVHLQLDSNPEVRDTDFDGQYTFLSVPDGLHTIKGYLVRADYSKIAGSDASVSFTVAAANAAPTVSTTADQYSVRIGDLLQFVVTAQDTDSATVTLEAPNVSAFPGAIFGGTSP